MVTTMVSKVAGSKVAVIGAGSWGTTVATLVARNCSTVLWARRADLAAEVNGHHTNRQYLLGYALPKQTMHLELLPSRMLLLDGPKICSV